MSQSDANSLSRNIAPSTRLLRALALLALCGPLAPAQRLSDLATTPIPPGSTLVLGFLGFYDRWDDDHRGVRQLVLHLRREPNVYAESFSNHRQSLALAFIRRALDTNHDGELDPEEKAQARIILFGQSWGGAAAIDVARQLDRLGIPVLLTAQIDSVGLNDAVIPSNVRAAVNFYQHDPFTIQGRSAIRAADPAATEILGNFQSSYLFRSVDKSHASLARRTLGGGHIKMELDPTLWRRVERFISEAIARR
jgi:pimeloyl-ACP methyl ester carboxylesterase